MSETVNALLQEMVRNMSKLVNQIFWLKELFHMSQIVETFKVFILLHSLSVIKYLQSIYYGQSIWKSLVILCFYKICTLNQTL